MKEREHNQDKKTPPVSWASHLDSLEKNLSGGFSVPENYFEALSKNISDKVQSIPNLNSVPKENVFEVPDGYFAQLENSIRENVSSQATPVYAQVEQWFRRPKLVLVYASVAAVMIVTSVYFLNTNHAVTEKDISFNDIYSSDIVSELDETALAALLDEPSASTSTQLEDYVIDNNIDVSTLTEEL
jgi:hypothetical protein